MMTKTAVNRIFLIVWITIGLLSCGERQEIPDSFPPTTINFDPSIDVFEGRPGEVLELQLNIEGPLGFNHLFLRKTVAGGEAEITALKEMQEEHYDTPFSMDFSYTLKEQEVGQEIKLTFMVGTAVKIPNGETGHTFVQRSIEITTKAE